jgi:hypothetical protein
MDDRTKMSLNLVVDVTKQLVVLTTAVISFTVTVLRDNVKDASGLGVLALVLAFISICAGLLQLLVVTGTIASKKIPDAAISINHPVMRLLGITQLATFAAAIGFLAFRI